jgi:hypothetical protein
MADALETASTFLENLQRFELSALLGECAISIQDVKGGFVDDDWYSNLRDEVPVVLAPAPIDEALRCLPSSDRKRIGEAIAHGYRNNRSFEDIRVDSIPHVVEGVVALLSELITHRAMMVSVATGGERIQEVNDYYRAREHRIRQSLPADVPYRNPHQDLWEWYRYWSDNLPQYKDRRRYIREMFDPAIEALAKRSASPLPEREPSGWERVDRTLAKAKAQFELASNEEDFQGVGLLCREVLISLAQAVFDPKIHASTDGVKPSATDANRMFEAYVGHVFGGASYQEVRAHQRASLALALNLQHRRTATHKLAALCLEATTSTVAVIKIISENADSDPETPED